MDIISGHESYKNYQQQRQTMEDLLGRASGVISTLNMGQYGENLKALQNKIHDDSFKIMVVGTFKNGKSTFINSFLGEDILPAYSIPCTAVITLPSEEEIAARIEGGLLTVGKESTVLLTGSFQKVTADGE